MKLAYPQATIDGNRLALRDAEVMDELLASFGLAIPTGILCIYIVAHRGHDGSNGHTPCMTGPNNLMNTVIFRLRPCIR